uniref:Uncharacterized protein n=1 Tax=Anguilla anguilla TaxID=7936 RepID=A0A0E9P5P2_ANGAN
MNELHTRYAEKGARGSGGLPATSSDTRSELLFYIVLISTVRRRL